MAKEKHSDDLELPALFDTDEPLFLEGLGDNVLSPLLTYADLVTLGGTGGGGGGSDGGSTGDNDGGDDGDGDGDGDGG